MKIRRKINQLIEHKKKPRKINKFIDYDIRLYSADNYEEEDITKREIEIWIRKNLFTTDTSFEQIVKDLNISSVEVFEELVNQYLNTYSTAQRSKTCERWLKKYYETTDLRLKDIGKRFGLAAVTISKKTQKLNLYKYNSKKHKEQKSNVKKKTKITHTPKKTQTEKTNKKKKVEITQKNEFNQIYLDKREMFRKELPDLYHFLRYKFFGEKSVDYISKKFEVDRSSVISIMREINVYGYYAHALAPEQIKYIREVFMFEAIPVREVLELELFRGVEKRIFDNFLNKF